MTRDSLKKCIIDNSAKIDGKVKLTCPTAFKIAEEQGVNLLDIAKICNEDDIKICKCQLGCFE